MLLLLPPEFSKKIIQEHYLSGVSNRDKDPHSVGPDLGPNCLQRLSADNKSRH